MSSAKANLKPNVGYWRKRRFSDRRGGAILDAIIWMCIAFIVGSMAFSMLGSTGGGSREKARRINCAGNLKQIGLALIIYAGDDVEDGMFPDDNQFGTLHYHNYLTNGKVYTCPSCANPSTEASNSNYVYLGSGLADNHPNPREVILAHDRLENHEGWVNCLYLDGHVKGHRSSAETWDEFRDEREAAGDLILNRPDGSGIAEAGVLPTYQDLD